VSWPEFAELHPFADHQTLATQGWVADLEVGWRPARACGVFAGSPMPGPQGEYAALL